MSEVYTYRQPNRTYYVANNEVRGTITDSFKAVKQAIQHILMTERYSNPIYSSNYGIELEQYAGKDIAYLTASIEDTIKDALLQDDRITDVMVTDINQMNLDSVEVSFMVYTIFGNYEETLNVIQ